MATNVLIKELKRINPDLINIHNIHGYYVNYKMLFNYLATTNIKIIWTLHDCWAFTGHCSHFEYEKCDKWKTGCRLCRFKKEYPKSILLSASYNNYLTKKESFLSIKPSNMLLVCPSKWLKEYVDQSFLNKYHSLVINNGINTDIFKFTNSNLREKYSLKDKIIVLGVASVWSSKKGFFDFIDLANRLDDRFYIVMIGVTGKQIDLLPSNVIGIARTENQQQLAEWYSTADVLYNPTYEDNYPTVLLEAVACQLGILTSDVGGCKEIVRHTSNYDFIDKNNVIEQIISIYKKGRNNIVDNFDVSETKSIDKYHTIIVEYLKEASK